LKEKIEKLEEALSAQKDETNKYKSKKDQLKENLKQCEDACKTV
jgi:chromosome segregation ATPase